MKDVLVVVTLDVAGAPEIDGSQPRAPDRLNDRLGRLVIEIAEELDLDDAILDPTAPAPPVCLWREVHCFERHLDPSEIVLRGEVRHK